MRGIMLTVCIMAGLCLAVHAQQDYRIFLKAGTIETPDSTLQLKNQPALLQQQPFNGYYYVLLQFEHIPTIVWREELAASGVELLQYLPNYTYLAKISPKTDINGLEVRAVLPFRPEYKLSGSVSGGIYPAHAIHPDGIALQAIPFPGIPASQLYEALQDSGFQPHSEKNGVVQLHLPAGQIPNLAAHPGIMYIETEEPAPTAEGIRGRSLHGANWLSPAPGLGYDGSGIVLSIGDDGSINHADFKGRLHDHTEYNLGTHGDMTAGLAVGSGNINPMGSGMATGAELHLFGIDNYTHLLDAPQYFQQYGAVITSTSYGEGCGGEYTSSAQGLDQQVNDVNELLHFFSSGNSSAVDCSPTYQNIQHPDGHFYGNITGGRKSAKNVLAIGNLDYDGQLRASSSRGPTVDGRIKPDLCAQGQGNLTTNGNNGYSWASGSSAASPVAAGATAMLYQAYKTHNNDQLPSSALIKAILLNTAIDLGRPGPDFDYGWGKLDAASALEVIENQQYLQGSINQAGVHTHHIHVPDDVTELKVMVYWMDAAGSPIASKALVNDIDIELEAPNSTLYRPWVLNTHPHIDSLTAPARRGEDHLNNMEQITILNPNSGTYKVKVRGNIIPQAPQSYHLVYYFQRDELTLKYPRGGEGFVPGEYQVVRWDAFGSEGQFTLEYSLNGMNDWALIANNIDGSQRHYDWIVPSNVVGKAFLRISRDGQSAVNQEYFSLIGQPSFDFDYVDESTARISWHPVPGADRYDVYTLGEKYMEMIDSTTNTQMEVSINLEERKWYSVRARKKTSLIGRRAIAKAYRHQPCETALSLQLQLDMYPQETSWEITDQNGEVVASGGPYHHITGETLLEIEKCLPYGCYDFTIFDSHGDGIESGYYTILDEDGNMLIQGDQFADKETQSFCLNANPTTLSLEVISLEQVSCYNSTDGSIAVQAQGGTGNYSYLWNTGATGNAIQNLSAGTYSVTVNDGEHIASLSISLEEPAELDLNINIVDTSCGQSDGAAYASGSGGTTPYTFAWSTGATGTALTDLAAGTYSLTLTDASGCTLTENISIGDSEAFELDFTVVDVSCYDGNDGFIEVLPNGGNAPFTAIWSDGTESMTLENLSAGAYEVTVTDQNACTASESVIVLQNPPVEISLEGNSATDGNNGSINLYAEGGISPYTYAWSNGATSQNLSNLGGGTFSVTLTDANGCTAEESIQIGGPTAVVYCDTWGQNNSFEWIESVQFGPLNNESGNNDGYGDFTNTITELERGQTYSVLLEPGHTSTAYNEYWRIWIDWNVDGDFEDENELMFTSPAINIPVLVSITLPIDVEAVTTRMRISMQFGSAPEPCGAFPYGEAEDYTIKIRNNYVYCTTGGQSTNYEWIESVNINGMAHSSGDNDGYADFSEVHFQAEAGETIPITLSPGHSGTPYNEFWSIWVDFNEDGQFNGENETIYTSAGSTTTINGFMDIPAEASPGLRRMRISMKWGSSAEPCEIFSWGETEDYTIEIIDGEGRIPDSGVAFRNETSGEGNDGGNTSQEVWGGKDPIFYPNPAQSFIKLKHYSNINHSLDVSILDAKGKLLLHQAMEVAIGINEYHLDIHALPAGIYLLRIRQGQARWQKKLVVVPQQQN